MTPVSNDELCDGVLDLLVVGGGIVGAGVVRDAAIRGLRTGLIDQADFAFGTSSRSSRLLHGGLRYLSQGRLPQVRQASGEKQILQRIAPHLAEPLAFVFPTRRRTHWPRWKLRLGVGLYELLSGARFLSECGALSPAQTLGAVPGLSTRDLTGAVRYYDAFTNDARLVLDTLRSAARHGATVRNYVRLDAADPARDAWRCAARDSETGDRLEIQARCIVNATGPWSDRIPHSRTRLRLTKGVHLVVDRARLGLSSALVMPEGRRILFAIPWGQRVILGTTDTDYDGPLERPTCDPDDMKYVLNVTNEAFDGLNLGSADVISTWAGLRPLVADRKGRPSDISRRHEIHMGEPGWIDVTGGKLTTYRLMAAETVDRIVRYLGGARERCRTADSALLAPEEATGLSAVVPPDVQERAVEHYCRHEWARHLDDVMIRRTGWRHYHRDHQSVAARVAGWMAQALGWDPATRDRELRRYERITGESSRT